MAIHVIVDGYNLLGARGQFPPNTVEEGEVFRDGLIKELSLYHHRKGHSLTVVFDAWKVRGGVESREHRVGVQVIYTKDGERADAVIQRLSRKYGSHCAVVTSDHEILQTAQAHRSLVIPSQEFQTRLQRALSEKHSIDHTLRMEKGVMNQDRDEQPHPRVGKKGNPRKLPKALRDRNRRLKGF